MVHTEHITSEQLRGLDVFSGLPAASLQRLLRVSHVRHLSPRDSLSSRHRGNGRHYYFLLRGVLAIALDSEQPQPLAESRGSRRPPHGQRFLGYFEPGACFSDSFLNEQPETRLSRLDCVATNSVSLLELEQAHLGDLFASEPLWHSQLADAVASARELFLTRQDPACRVVQDFFLRENYVTSSSVRVSRLDRCIDCNKCHDACAKRHGQARMARIGPSLGRLTFPIACRNCHDQPCIAACSFGGIAFDAASGDVHISDRCVGCGACAKECPNEAISMIWRPYTVADFPEPMPLSDADGVTNVSNLLVAGDISGAALIRLAINEAVRAVDRIEPKGLPRNDQALDVAIIGGGPAGLAAALRCRERQLSYCVFERDWLASTIRSYPKNKRVMAEPSNIASQSSLWFGECSKEELLERWQKAATEEQIRILEQTEVRRIEKSDRLFTVHSSQGRFAAENVLVCVGKRGAPRRLGLPGESHPRVRYLLDDPDDHTNQRILVVGGGDSALEVALALADVAGTKVTLSYRQGAFTRAKAQNRRRIEDYQAAGRIQVELKSRLLAIEPRVVRLATEHGEMNIPNDSVFAMLGADPPTEFLRDAGIQVLQPGSSEMAALAARRGKRQRAVKCDHCAGYADRACLAACPTGALTEVQTDQLFFEAEPDPLTRSRRFSDAPFLLGVPGRPARFKSWTAACTLIILFCIGLECFLIRTQPENSLLGHYVQATRSRITVSFTSGRGIGHWFGYVGASMMLVSVLYSARTRIGALKRWGSQTGWFSAHIWFGFTGATLVTYHSALKLDRWASIACILMWIVVATGAIGRYLFGRVRSAAGLAQFEQWAAHRRRRNYYQGMDFILRHWNIVHIVLAIAMIILAGTHIVYGFRYKAV